MKHYMLDGKKITSTEDVLEWGRWFQTAKRHVAITTIGEVKISTVFLGLDYGWGISKKPVLFETMIFGGKHDQYQDRYCTWKQAEKGHEKAVKLVRGTK